MPDFSIEGNPAAIRARAAVSRSKGQSFVAVGESLARVTTDGWSGRAADKFRDAFDTEPGRWVTAGEGFVTAASALEGFADAVEAAQRRAAWASSEYARGEQVSAEARAAYDADVARARQEVATATAAGQVMTLQILPFQDPGATIRQGALDEYAAARSDLEAQAHACAAGVRAGCTAAPEARRWWESGLAFVGGIFAGAGEAVWDLLTLPGSPISLVQDGWDLATGTLTPEELAKKYQLGLETAQGMFSALRDDPVEFGQAMGKAMLDWDTWADDPARAIGRLLPDALLTAATLGGGGAVVAGSRSAQGAGMLARHGDDLLDGAGDAGRVAEGLDDLRDLERLDDLGDVRHVDLDSVPEWADGKAVPEDGLAADLYPDDFKRYGDLDRQEFFDHYWDSDHGSWHYPDEAAGYPDGFDGPAAPNGIQEGDVIDRFGNPGGYYASPSGTPFPDRALPPSSVGADYHQYRVLRPLPESVTEGRIAPWFEQPGGGVQYKFDRKIEWYEANEYLEKLP